MAKRGRKPIGLKAKSVGLTIRLDEKTKYALELIGRIDNKTGTRIIEDAIAKRIAAVKLSGRIWSDLWDENPGVRKLKELGCGDYPANEDEKEIRAFTRHHREFWYVDNRCTVPKQSTVEVLWPQLLHYMDAWRRYGAENPNVATDLMTKAIKAAKAKK